MPFEIAVPGHHRVKLLEPKRGLLWRGGLLVLHKEDVDAAKLGDGAVVLVDKATQRLALRPPADDEAMVTVRPRKDKAAEKAGGIAFYCGHGLKRGGWVIGKGATFHGPKQLVHRDDGLLLVLLEDGE